MDIRIVVSALSLFTSVYSMDNIVRLEPYNAEWRKAFMVEQALLRSTLHPSYAKTIDHVGSTSIPGMWAKPVVDILIGTDGDDVTASDIENLREIGYEFVERSAYCNRYYFKKMGSPISFNLSLTAYKGTTWKKIMAFRNYLFENSEARERYLAV